MKKLVLVESPAKAKTIQKYLSDATVAATYGHVRDLPKGTLGIDVENHFAPSYVIPKKAASVVSRLKSLVKKAPEIYLATDPDREGEAIAWHVAQALKLNPQKIHRVVFHEITPTAVSSAFAHPRTINQDLVDAQQARRVLDRLVGYGLSPLLWRQLYRGLSAGRVQSAALRLVVDRENEIDAFTSVEYWSLWATFTTGANESFQAKLVKIGAKPLGRYPTREHIRRAEDDNRKEFHVAQLTKEKKQRHPKPPFTTSTLQQEAGRKLSFSVKQTMMHAQKLYEEGMITYMRTDSVVLASVAVDQARKVIAGRFGTKFVPDRPNVYKTKSRGAQEAHEAIRPTDFTRLPESVKGELSSHESKLYKLIWERAIASQMGPAQVESTVAAITPKDATVTYEARGYQVLFEGFLRVYSESYDNPADSEESADNQRLPELAQGEALKLKEVEPKQHFTEPPPRYSEASLVKEMEKLGIGRPSTYAPTITTLIDRGYVQKIEGRFHPQEVGKLVVEFLKKRFPTVVDYEFTAEMEEKLDTIADGETKWYDVLASFYTPFENVLEKVKRDTVKTKLMDEKTDEKCPQCGEPLAIKMSRFGKFFACSGFPKCRYTRPFVADESGEDQSREIVEDRKCPNDGGDLVVKSGRYGPFIACDNYPKCKYIESIKKEIGVECPKDGGEIVERATRRGKLFWGCQNYPKCDFASWDKPVSTKCPTCGGLMVEKRQRVVCVKCEPPGDGQLKTPKRKSNTSRAGQSSK